MVDSSGTDSEAENSRWTWEENKQFEDGLVEFPGDCSNRWERIAARLGTKTAAEIEQHFAVLLDDVAAIQAGLIELPEYADKDGFRSSEPQKNPKSEKKQVGMQRKAARPWTEDEHRIKNKKFMIGVEDWKEVYWFKIVLKLSDLLDMDGPISNTMVQGWAQKYSLYSLGLGKLPYHIHYTKRYTLYNLLCIADESLPYLTDGMKFLVEWKSNCVFLIGLI
ncbi:hypothetical protein Pfo_023062 [Paulownia fortunei]|nr:hypothetical protein Pfo_023062 [Paulownia fortunei]